MTVLFADVVRSMDIAAALHMERLREIITELVDQSAALVQHYGGTAEYTGDGVMAVFGAPAALEDHALRACLAAVDIQNQANRLAAEVQRRDGVTLQLRVGLNSGRVIAGEIGSGSLGYRATGVHVGFAQRIESVAPPGGVLLSESTARLVEHKVRLAEPEWVRIKGFDEPVRARRLIAIDTRHRPAQRAEASLVGRRWEMAALDAVVDRAISGRGGVVNVVGPPGVGKSRTAREVARLAASRGVDVVWAFCESHTSDVPFGCVTQLLRAGLGVADLDGDAARVRVRALVPGADPQDLLLLDDMLGIADPDTALPEVDPDARRRRLTAMINAASKARPKPVLYVVEDAQWIDSVSESMLVDVLEVIAQVTSMMLITFRPEYRGALALRPGAQTITLAPLSDSETAALLAELLGSDPSVDALATTIADRAAGNPFFAEEMVRELVQRGVLRGEHGSYVCAADSAEVSVPDTVQAAIGSRIDRLDAAAKRTLTAASVIGERFGEDLLTVLATDPVLDDLVRAELVDQVGATPAADYAFRHPLIRAVAYESQLQSVRAERHRRLAVAIESGAPSSADQNAALIAEHLEAAGDMRAAYTWHMRAGAWSANRDIAAAGLSWQRALRITTALSSDNDSTAMRIAPLRMLCGTAWRIHANIADRFEELRELCTSVGDRASLAVGMAGIVTEHLFCGRVREASTLASEQMALLESIGDPGLTIQAGFMAVLVKYHRGEISDVLRWSQSVIDWAGGDPAKGNLIVGSPLALALVWRGIARFWLGRSGWRRDLDDAVATARHTDASSRAWVVIWKNQVAVGNGVLLPDDAAVCELDEALRVAERSGDDNALGLIKYTLGVVLLYRRAAADRRRGLDLVGQVRDMCLNRRFYRSELPVLEFSAGLEMARRGDHDGALAVMRKAVDQVFDEGRGLTYGVAGIAGLVETLLSRGGEDDLDEAQRAIDRLANVAAGEDLALRKITLLRLLALLAMARGDDVTYHELVESYRAMAESLGFEGHIAMAKAMVDG